MNISDRILKTIKKIAIDRNITEESVTYNEIAVEQAIELNKLNNMKKNKLKERIELLENKICTLSENNHKLQNENLAKDLEHCNNILKKYGDTILEMNREKLCFDIYSTNYTITLKL